MQIKLITYYVNESRGVFISTDIKNHRKLHSMILVVCPIYFIEIGQVVEARKWNKQTDFLIYNIRNNIFGRVANFFLPKAYQTNNNHKFKYLKNRPSACRARNRERVP